MNQISPRATYTIGKSTDVARYVRCIESSKRVRWDIADHIIQGWDFDTGQKYSPDGITKADQFTTLSADEKRYLSQIQGAGRRQHVWFGGVFRERQDLVNRPGSQAGRPNETGAVNPILR